MADFDPTAIDRQSISTDAMAPPQNYADFYNRLVAARMSQAQIPGNGALFSLNTGAKMKAAQASAANDAPGLWQQYQQTQMNVQNQGLSQAQNVASVQAMNPGVIVDRNNPQNNIPALTNSFNTQIPGLNGQQPQNGQQPPATPAGPPAVPGAPQNPIAQIDAMLGGKPANPQLVAGVESGGNPNAVSPKGATGPMQVMPDTAVDPGYGVKPMNGPADNARMGGDYLNALTQHYGSPTLGLIAYNWGPGNTDKWIQGGANMAQLPPETQQYVAKVIQAHGAAGQLPGLTNGQGQQPQGQPPQNAPADPNAPVRAFLNRYMIQRTLGGDPQGSKAYFDMIHSGQPEGTQVSPGGNFIPSVVSTPNGPISGQQFEAQGKGLGAASTLAGTNTQTNVPVVTRTGISNMPQSDVSANKGLMNADGKPNYLPADSPQYKVVQQQQQADIKDTRDAAVQSQATGNTAIQLYNAANQLPPVSTGQFGAAAQSYRKLAIGVLQAAGAKVNPALANDAAAFEKMNFQGLNFVQASAHGFSPRAALQIVKMIQSVKPGEKTTPQGIKQIIEQEVMPGVMRDQAMYGQTNAYYSKNPLATDAMVALPGKNPIENFSVKHDIHQVQPGDYFVDPTSGNLRQRPTE